MNWLEPPSGRAPRAMISAERKAESLARFAKEQGAPLDSFQVALTKGEAYEVLDELASGRLVKVHNRQLLLEDIEEAKLAGDPWRVLDAFTLHGLSMTRALDLQ